MILIFFLVTFARAIVEENGLSDKITIIKGKIEEIELPVEKVDIIISEWMGYFLLYESMLDTVLVARDKYLVEGGLILPSKATMFVAGIEDAEYKDEKIEFWNSVYGFNMSSIKFDALHEPLVDCVKRDAVATTAFAFKEIDILTVTKGDLSFQVPFTIHGARQDNIHALLSWFDIDFSGGLHKTIHFSTGPFAEYTHWKQTVFYLNDVIAVNDGDEITGQLTCRPNGSNPRDLDITIDVHYKGPNQELHERNDYKMC